MVDTGTEARFEHTIATGVVLFAVGAATAGWLPVPRPIMLLATFTAAAAMLALAMLRRGWTVRARGKQRSGSDALSATMEQLPAMVWTTGSDLGITSTRGAALAKLAFSPGDLVGLPVETLFAGTRHVELAAHRAALAGETVAFESTLAGRTYQAIVKPLAGDGGEGGVIGVALDVTARREAEEALRVALNFDALTGLRTIDGARAELAALFFAHPSVAIAVFDVARANAIAEAIGARRFNRLTTLAAERAATLRQGDDVLIIARRRSYVLFTAAGEDAETALAERIARAFEAPFTVEGETVYAPANIGIAFAPRDGEGIDQTLSAATIAYAHADVAAVPVVGYTPKLHAAANDRIRLESELRRALAQGELRVQYQPIVDCTSGLVLGAEALVRWQHPQRGLLFPPAFIDAAEASGLIPEIGEFVLHEATSHLASWRTQAPGLFLSVNVAAQQLEGDRIVECIDRILASGRFSPRALHVEITESSLMRDVTNASAVLRRLRSRGLGIALDDFGTGYSSLGYLKHFPIDTIKIDRSFANDGSSRHDDAILRAVISLARSLDLRTIVEGVETEGELEHVRALGSDAYQGFRFSEAVEPSAFAALLEARTRRTRDRAQNVRVAAGLTPGS